MPSCTRALLLSQAWQLNPAACVGGESVGHRGIHHAPLSQPVRRFTCKQTLSTCPAPMATRQRPPPPSSVFSRQRCLLGLTWSSLAGELGACSTAHGRAEWPTGSWACRECAIQEHHCSAMKDVPRQHRGLRIPSSDSHVHSWRFVTGVHAPDASEAWCGVKLTSRTATSQLQEGWTPISHTHQASQHA